jgi:hypothetical protein
MIPRMGFILWITFGCIFAEAGRKSTASLQYVRAGPGAETTYSHGQPMSNPPAENPLMKIETDLERIVGGLTPAQVLALADALEEEARQLRAGLVKQDVPVSLWLPATARPSPPPVSLDRN